MSPGQFYALPQSPQLFKQLLMVGGVERYYQIARCFRDEDLRADRQPEFTQVDIEMSFIRQDDILQMMEEVMREVMHEAGHDLHVPLPRITYADAMERFGCDRPDTRFGLELVDVFDVFAASGFKVFSGALASGGAIKAINAKGAGDWSRSRIDALNTFALEQGAKGLAWVAFTWEGEVRSPIAKFFTDDEMAALKAALAVEPGDLVCMVADARQSPTTSWAPCACVWPTSWRYRVTASRPCGSSTSRSSSGTRTRSAGRRTTTPSPALRRGPRPRSPRTPATR